VVTLDPAQLDSLRVFTGDRCSELVAGMIEDTGKLVAELPAAVARDDFSAVVEAAHRGRNDALVVGAREFGDVFAVLQGAARKAQLGAVQEAVERLQAMWPATRAAIVDLLVRPRSNS
jgi:hypothetical protein